MSVVKKLAFAVMVTGTLTSSTQAGSICQCGGQRSHSHAAGRATANPDSPTSGDAAKPALSTRRAGQGLVAAANLAGGTSNWGGGGPGASNSRGWGGGSLVLGTNQAEALSNSPFDFGNASFRVARSAAANPASPMPIAKLAESPAAPFDAYINFGSGPFAEARALTDGNARPFYESPTFTRFFRDGPSSQDINNFQDLVLTTIRNDYDTPDRPIRLTTDPGLDAAHTLSVVSNTHNPDNPDAIGITRVGGDGFSFIDIINRYNDAKDPDELAVAVGHNVSHELMHAFGLADHPEQSGPFVDAATTTFSALSDPDTGFSPEARSLLSTLDFQDSGSTIIAGGQLIDGDQVLLPQASPVPEPSTVALWGLIGGIAVVARRRGRGRGRASA